MFTSKQTSFRHDFVKVIQNDNVVFYVDVGSIMWTFLIFYHFVRPPIPNAKAINTSIKNNYSCVKDNLKNSLLLMS